MMHQPGRGGEYKRVDSNIIVSTLFWGMDENVPHPLQWNSKQFFITWPRCPIPAPVALEDIINILYGRQRQRESFHIRMAQEEHDDGGLHLHAFIRLDKALRFRNSSLFDLQHYHPNIQGVRNTVAVLAYVSKDGNYVDHGHPEPLGYLDHGDAQPQGRVSKWSAIVGAETREEFMDAIKTAAPRDYVLSLERIKFYADYRYAVDTPIYAHDPTLVFNLPARVSPDLNRWTLQRQNVSKLNLVI
ncbi:MAG: Rep protein [CRESS virus sp. ctpVY4]|nr:MAG: Rep protein [CRESS virus sp. ctpVY4]